MAGSHVPGDGATITTEDEPVKEVGRFRTALPQVLASTAKNMILLDLGMTVAFPTIVIPKLHNTTDPLALNSEQTSWFGSIMYICQPLGSVLSGIVLERLGRKKSMILVNFPHVVGWFTFCFASSVPMLYFAAVIMGLGIGFVEAPIITYVGEISQPHLRGVLTSYAGIFVQLGFNFVYLLGPLTHWKTAAGISAAVPIAAVIAISQVPETPIWLLCKGRTEEAQKSLCWLRGWVPPNAVRKEFSELVLYSENIRNQKGGPDKSAGDGDAVPCFGKSAFMGKLRELLQPQTLRPLAVVCMFFFFQHCSGFTAMRPYMVQVFQEFGLPMDAYWVTVLIGVVGLIGNAVCMVGVAWWGKRPLSLVSIAAASMASILLGAYAFAVISPGEVATAGTRHAASWVPMTLFIVYAFMQSVGVLPVPWMILSEVFPFRSRGLASGIAAAGSYVLAFLASKTFLSLKSALSLHGVFWLYGSLGFVGFFAIYWTFSETEGRSLEQIEEFYKKGLRGKIPMREITDETSKETSINFSPSTCSVAIKKEDEVNSNDEDRMGNNISLTNRGSRNKADNDVSEDPGRSMETMDTALTVSTADIHDPKSSNGDVTSVDEIQKVSEEELEESKHKEEKYKKEKVTEGEISDGIRDFKETPKRSKAEEGKCSEVNATDGVVVKEDENCIKEKVDGHTEDAEERTKM